MIRSVGRKRSDSFSKIIKSCSIAKIQDLLYTFTNMADTAKLILEVLSKITPDITAMVIKQLEKEKKSVS